MYKLHVEGTRLLCDAAKKAGANTIVLASSSGTIAVSEKSDVVADETYSAPARRHRALALLRQQSVSGRWPRWNDSAAKACVS